VKPVLHGSFGSGEEDEFVLWGLIPVWREDSSTVFSLYSEQHYDVTSKIGFTSKVLELINGFSPFSFQRRKAVAKSAFNFKRPFSDIFVLIH
jgi:hypothetical protein